MAIRQIDVRLVGGELDGRDIPTICDHRMLEMPDEPGMPAGQCFFLDYEIEGEIRSALYEISGDLALCVQTLDAAGRRIGEYGSQA